MVRRISVGVCLSLVVVACGGEDLTLGEYSTQGQAITMVMEERIQALDSGLDFQTANTDDVNDYRNRRIKREPDVRIEARQGPARGPGVQLRLDQVDSGSAEWRCLCSSIRCVSAAAPIAMAAPSATPAAASESQWARRYTRLSAMTTANAIAKISRFRRFGPAGTSTITAAMAIAPPTTAWPEGNDQLDVSTSDIVGRGLM